MRCPLLEVIFSSFHPGDVGVIDYHGAHRNYAREALGGINLNLDQEEERIRTTSLYNVANKYSNIKSEMAAEYVKESLREKFPGNPFTKPFAEASNGDITRVIFNLLSGKGPFWAQCRRVRAIWSFLYVLE